MRKDDSFDVEVVLSKTFDCNKKGRSLLRPPISVAGEAYPARRRRPESSSATASRTDSCVLLLFRLRFPEDFEIGTLDILRDCLPSILILNPFPGGPPGAFAHSRIGNQKPESVGEIDSVPPLKGKDMRSSVPKSGTPLT